MAKLLPFCLAFLCVHCVRATTQLRRPNNCDIIVEPVAGEIQRAADAIHASALSHVVNSTLTVCLRAGVHDVSKTPLKFSNLAMPVRWVGDPGAIVSAGVQLTGWRLTTLGSGPAYAAAVPPGTFISPAVARQLWVGGRRANRTSISVSSLLGRLTPWHSADGMVTGFITQHAPPAIWTENATSSIEFTWPLVVKNWISPRCTIATISGTNITLAKPCGGFLLTRCEGAALPPPVNAEAVPAGAFPLTPGTFYHDVVGESIFYALAHGQTAADLENDAWITSSEVLISYTNVSGHEWNGVTFSYGTWLQPNTGDGFVDDQSAVYDCTPGAPNCNINAVNRRRSASALSGSLRGPPQGTGEPRGNIRVSRGRFISFVNCTFEHLGAPYALSVMEASQNVSVSGCRFRDLSGGFLKFGSIGVTDGNSSDPDMWDAFLSATDNTASNLALEYTGAAGFFGGFIWRSDVSHNTVSDAGALHVPARVVQGATPPPSGLLIGRRYVCDGAQNHYLCSTYLFPQAQDILVLA